MKWSAGRKLLIALLIAFLTGPACQPNLVTAATQPVETGFDRWWNCLEAGDNISSPTSVYEAVISEDPRIFVVSVP